MTPTFRRFLAEWGTAAVVLLTLVGLLYALYLVLR